MATLRVDLDDEASEGLESLNAQLDQTAKATEVVAVAAVHLTQVQQNQTTIINNNRKGWSEFGSTLVGVYGDVATTGINAFRDIEVATIKGTVAITNAGYHTATSIINTAIVTTGAVMGIKAVWGKHDQKIKESTSIVEDSTEVQRSSISRLVGAMALLGPAGVAMGTAAKLGYGDVTAAATFATKAVLGVGPQILGAKVGWEIYAAVLARTGLRTVELADGTKVLESNLDRVHQATGKFGEDLSRDFKEASDAFSSLMDVSITFPDVWQSIDEDATKSAEHLIENVGLIRSGYNEAVISLRAFAVQMGGGNAEAYRKEIGLVRELSDWHAKMDKQREAEVEHFDRLRSANAVVESRALARAEAERVASIKTVDGVDSEIQALKNKAGQMAAALKFDESAQRAYNDQMMALEQRRQAIEKEGSTKRSEYHRKAREEYTEEMKSIDDLIARTREVYDLDVKRIEAKNRMNRELVGAAKGQDFQTGMDAAKDMHAGEKELAEARLKSQGATDAAIRTELSKMDRQFNEKAHTAKMQQIADESKSKMDQLEKERLKLEKSGIDGSEREKRLSLIQQEEDKVIFERRKKAIEEQGRFEREQNKLTIDEARQRELDKFKQLADAKKKAGVGGNAGGGVGKVGGKPDANADEILNAQDPKKVLRELQELRAKQAQKEQAERDRDLWVKGQNIGMPGQQAAAKQFAENQRKAMAAARRQAFDDAQNGNVDDGELKNAQNNVAKQTISTMQKQGKLNVDQVKAMTDLLQQAVDTANTVDQLQATVDQLVAAAKGQKQVAKRQAENARNQANSLE